MECEVGGSYSNVRISNLVPITVITDSGTLNLKELQLKETRKAMCCKYIRKTTSCMNLVIMNAFCLRQSNIFM